MSVLQLAEGRHRYYCVLFWCCQQWRGKLCVEFSGLVLFCGNVLTGKMPHSADFLFICLFDKSRWGGGGGGFMAGTNPSYSRNHKTSLDILGHSRIKSVLWVNTNKYGKVPKRVSVEN